MFPRFSNVWFLRKNAIGTLVRGLRLALALALIVSLLASPARAAARDVDIEVGTNPDGSMYLRPGNVTVNVGDDVTLRIRNVDRIFHDVALLDYDGNDVEIEVPGGKTESHSFKATVAGDYRMICEVSGHKQKGMFGLLHVVDPSARTRGFEGFLALAAFGFVAFTLSRRR